MPSRLRDLIRLVRQCKTAQEERDVIAKEAAALRQAFKEQDGTYRHRNVAKLMFMHMLGYPTHFGQMETLKLIASSGFPDKRLGYLGLMILLDERQEVLMLVTNSLKNDLNSRNQYIVGLALTALGNICSAEMARDLAPEVEKLIANANPYIRKKAALCARRVVRKVPDTLESFVDRAMDLLNDRNHAVVLTGVTLILDMCEQEPAVVAIFRDQVPLLCRILRSLLVGGFSAEYDINGVMDPFLQVKILRLLRILGHGSSQASDAMSDVLAQVATNTESKKSSGNAVLYECVQTIMAVESIGGLRVLAVNTLGRFLANADNNMRYVALNTLAKTVAIDSQAVQRHRATIVECVKDADASIRKKALELVYALVNEGNVKTLIKELIDYLAVCDTDFKPDLAAKVCSLVQRFAPDKRWYVDSILQVLMQAGAYVKEEPCRALMLVILNATHLHGYAARAAYHALKEQGEAAAPMLVMVATWCIGEYGDLIVSGSGRIEGEESMPTSGRDIIALLQEVLNNFKATTSSKEYSITALAKLSSRLPSVAPVIQSLLQEHSRDLNLEVQSRSVEFSRLFNHESIRPQVLEHIPALEESSFDAGLDATEASAGGAAENAGTAEAAADLAALLGLDAGLMALEETSTSTGGATGPPFMGDGLSALQDLLGGAGNESAAPAATSTTENLDDLFGSVAIAESTPPAPVSFTAYEKGGIKVDFAVVKDPANPAAVTITASYTNTGSEDVTNFSLQAAVPKFMQLKLEPATGSALPAGKAGAVKQVVHITNSMHGQKPLVMRLRLTFARGSENVTEQAEVNNFPAN